MIVLTEHIFESEIVTESVADTKHLYIKGIYAQANKLNRNGRIYPRGVLESSMDKYQRVIAERQSVGELEHPTNLKINTDNICMLVTECTQNGDNWIGAARVLNTPKGAILRGLIEGGVKMGVSTRAAGKVKKNTRGLNEVQNGLHMIAVDSVLHPSAIDAYVDGVMENASWVMEGHNEDLELIESIKGVINEATLARMHEAKMQAFNMMLASFNS